MRKVKTIKIDNKELTIKELTVRQVWQLVNGVDGGSADDVGAAIARIEQLLTLSCSELTREEAMDMAPSELMQIWRVFKEVNADFLGLAEQIGLNGDKLLGIAREIVTDSIKLLDASSSQGMGLVSGDTDSVSS